MTISVRDGIRLARIPTGFIARCQAPDFNGREPILSHQRTLNRAVHCEGIGLHTGEPVAMTLRPAPANRGVTFRRLDLPGAPVIPARPDSVVDTHYATTVAKDGASVKTIEHIMSALVGMGVDNVQIDLTGPEVPIMDGSALPFVELLRAAGLFHISRLQYDRVKFRYYQAPPNREQPRWSPLDPYYTILGSSPADSLDVVKQKFRKLAMQWHPDKLLAKGASPEAMRHAKEKFQQINEAYEKILEARK